MSGGSVSSAVAKANATAHYVANRCLQFVAGVYGIASGYSSARVAWGAIPAQYKHSGGTPPAGAWVFFNTHNPGGHVAISLGGGKVRSTDFSNGRYSPGNVGTGTIAQVSSAMGGSYLGWASPYQAGHGLVSGNLSGGSSSPISNAVHGGLGAAVTGIDGGTSDGSSSGGDGSTPGLGQLVGNLISLVFWERVLYIVGGSLLLILGVIAVISNSRTVANASAAVAPLGKVVG